MLFLIGIFLLDYRLVALVKLIVLRKPCASRPAPLSTMIPVSIQPIIDLLISPIQIFLLCYMPRGRAPKNTKLRAVCSTGRTFQGPNYVKGYVVHKTVPEMQ